MHARNIFWIFLLQTDLSRHRSSKIELVASAIATGKSSQLQPTDTSKLLPYENKIHFLLEKRQVVEVTKINTR